MNIIRKKLLVTGDETSGKTCLILVYLKGQLPEIYIPSFVENSVTDVTIDQKNIELGIWNTTGEENYDRLRPLSYPNTDVILLCFAINRPDSIINILEKWTPECKQFCPNVPIILVGNKKDLRTDKATKKQLKKINCEPVPYEIGQAVAQRIGAVAYFECSAETHEGIQELFQFAARTALTHKSKQDTCTLF